MVIIPNLRTVILAGSMMLTTAAAHGGADRANPDGGAVQKYTNTLYKSELTPRLLALLDSQDREQHSTLLYRRAPLVLGDRIQRATALTPRSPGFFSSTSGQSKLGGDQSGSPPSGDDDITPSSSSGSSSSASSLSSSKASPFVRLSQTRRNSNLAMTPTTSTQQAVDRTAELVSSQRSSSFKKRASSADTLKTGGSTTTTKAHVTQNESPSTSKTFGGRLSTFFGGEKSRLTSRRDMDFE